MVCLSKYKAKIMLFKTLISTNLFIGMISFSMNAQTNQVMENQILKTEHENVLNSIGRMTEAFHKHDIEGVMASYEKDAVVVFEPEQPVSNSDSLRALFQSAFMLNPQFTYSGHEVFICGNIATHFAPWTMRGETPDGMEIIQNGLSVAILRKQKNGDWLMIFDNPHGQYLMDKKADE